VRVGSNDELSVTATFSGAVDGVLGVDDSALPFVGDVTLVGAAGRLPLARRDGGYAAACGAPCRVDYRFALRNAAENLSDVDTAISLGNVIVAPPSTWLLRPYGWSHGRYRFRVRTEAGTAFATGVRPAAGAAATYEGELTDIEQSAFSAFGALTRLSIAPGVEADIASDLGFSSDQIVEWLRGAFGAISAYLGRFPEDHVVVFVTRGTSDVIRGKTLGGGGASILVRLGTRTTVSDLADDWVVAHELVHVGFPVLGYVHGWFSEGLATYVEPVARARRGLLSLDEFWRGFVEGFPEGLPGEGDRGLEGSEAWGRVYWGGALYFLLADVEIRYRTSGRRSLDDAVRAVAATGANVETEWPLEHVLDVGDRATGTRVLHELYAKYATVPAAPDLAELWTRLGIRQVKGSGGIRFDDDAPWAGIRRAITAETSEAYANPVKNRAR